MADYSRQQWLAIRDNGGSLSKFYRSRSSYVHISARCGMRPDPRGPNFPMIPWVQKPGVTYRRAG